MRALRVGATALALAVLTATQVSAAKAPSGSPVVVGAILSMSGPYAPLGEPERNALQVAEKDINAHGGVGGRPIQFKIVDDEGKADTAQQLATQLVGEHVAMLIGGTLTPTSRVISRVANDGKVAQIFMTPTQDIWNTNRGVAKYTFEATPRNELEGEKLAAFIKNRLHRAKIALVHDDQQYGTVGAGVFSGEAKKQGLEIVDDESFAPTATDVTPQLQKVMKSGADAIVIWTAAPTAAILVRQAKQFGFKGDIIGSTGIVSDNFLKVSGREGYGVYADQDLDLTHPNAQQKAFIDAYRGAYHARPNNFASFAWDAAHLAAWALNGTKLGNGDAISGAFEGMKPYRGSTGVYRFTAADHNGMNASDIRIVKEEGAWVTLPANQQ
jgi:branched-chain amino acid transport system substrate-binding protein